MPKTGAERQRAWRQRRSPAIAAVEAGSTQLRAELTDVCGQLADAFAGRACRHPSAAVDGTCRACGTDVW